MTDLFYILDIGDPLAEGPLSGVFTPLMANVVGHVLSFALNGALWVGLIAAAAHVI